MQRLELEPLQADLGQGPVLGVAHVPGQELDAGDDRFDSLVEGCLVAPAGEVPIDGVLHRLSMLRQQVFR